MSNSKIIGQNFNTNYPNGMQKMPPSYMTMPAPVNSIEDLHDEFVSVKKKRGLFARIFDSVLPFQYNSRKVKKQIKNYQYGLTEKDKAQKSIERYEKANKNTSETVIDTISTATAMITGLAIKKTGTIINIFTTKLKSKTALAAAGTSVLVGFLTKLILKGVDLIGMNKEGRKEESFSSTALTGTLNGAGGYLAALSPVLLPFGLAAGALTRYIKAKKHDDKDSSVSDFLQQQKDTIAIATLGLAGIATVATKGHLNVSEITNSIKSVAVNKKHTISYRPPADQLTEFQQLARDIGYDLTVIIKGEKFDPIDIAKLDEDFMKILLEKGQTGEIDSKIKKLEQENIFLPKYLQTVVDIPEEFQSKLCKQIDELVTSYNNRKGQDRFWGNGRDFNWNLEEHAIDEVMEKLEKKDMDINGLKDLQGILRKIKSSCSRSRTKEEAQELLNKDYGNRYTITKPCGVGSVAETYLATDNNTNEEVVIKIIKDYFLCENKIAKDKAKVVEKINQRAVDDYLTQTIKTPERKKYDLNQVDNMYEVWGGEIDLNHEAEAARLVAEQAKNFNSVKVIDSKKHIFVMGKAEGVQLDSSNFVKLWKEKNLGEEDFKNLVENYVKVYCEQLFSIPKSCLKVVQSDPHGGNIFVNLDLVKDIKNGANPFRLIDYGNTTQTDQSQAIKNLFNHLDYIVGNTESIAEAMIEGANLGKNNKRDVIKELSQALKDAIYNPDTKLDVDNPVKIFSTVNSFCLEFMQKKNIIPNASHINQMKAEETYIISNLGCLKNIADECHYDLKKCVDKEIIVNMLIGEMTKAIEESAKVNPKLTVSEIAKRYKFLVNNTEEALSCLGINFGII